MKSYTFMSDEGIQAVIKAHEEWRAKDPRNAYTITLSISDFENLIKALKDFYDYHDPDLSSELAEWAGGYVSSIAETLGVEFV